MSTNIFDIAADDFNPNAQFGVEVITPETIPEDILRKRVFERWSVRDCALEHAARLSNPDYPPFGYSRSTLRRLLIKCRNER